MKKLFFLLIAGLLAIAMVACSSGNTSSEGESDSSSLGNDSSSESEASSGKPDNYTISMTTGTTTGTYYPLGAIFSKFWNDKLDYIEASSQASNGSVQNLIFIKEGDAQLALTPVITLYDAYNGQASFEGNKVDNVRVLAGLYPNVNHFVVRKDSGIEDIGDVEGKKIVPGATGSATEIETQHTLAAYGVDYEAMDKNFVGFTEATDLMRNKQTDAAMIMAGVPTAAVTEMLSTANGELLSYTDEAIAKLQEKYPTTSEYTIKANSYENQPEDIKTVAQFNFLVAPADMPDEVAYDLVKTFWDNVDELVGQHAVIEQFDINTALEGASELPIHPGAEKYYKEEGIIE